MFETFVLGRRIWLERVIPLFEQEMTKTHSDAIEAAKQFKEKFSALTYDLSAEGRSKTSVVSPKCGNLIAGADVSTQGQKLLLLRNLNQIIETRPVPPVNFNSWLKERHATYQAWLARYR